MFWDSWEVGRRWETYKQSDPVGLSPLPVFWREAQLPSAWEPQSKPGVASSAGVTGKALAGDFGLWWCPHLPALTPLGTAGTAVTGSGSSRWAQAARPGSNHWCEKANERGKTKEKSLGDREKTKA